MKHKYSTLISLDLSTIIVQRDLTTDMPSVSRNFAELDDRIVVLAVNLRRLPTHKSPYRLILKYLRVFSEILPIDLLHTVLILDMDALEYRRLSCDLKLYTTQYVMIQLHDVQATTLNLNYRRIIYHDFKIRKPACRAKSYENVFFFQY